MALINQLNTYMLDWEHPVVGDFTSSEKQKTITHEFWHSLGLAHSLPWNIMIQWKISQTSLWTKDKADYDYMW